MTTVERNEIRKAALQSYLTARRNGASEPRAYRLAHEKAATMGAGDLAERLASLAQEQAGEGNDHE